MNGLQEGDRIVASANFLIDAESQVQGALKDWEGEQPAGTPVMTEKPPGQSSNSNFNAVVKPVLDSYKRLHELLADNKFSQVSAEAETLRKQVHALTNIDPPSKPEQYKDLVGGLHSSAEQFTPNDIEQARVVFVILGIAGGIYALYQTPLDAIPDLSDVQVIVYADWEGRSPDLVEDQITYPISTKFIAAPKVKFVRGESMFGKSFVYVIFQDGTDIYWARSRVIEYLNSVRGSLPEGVNPVIGPEATGVGWVSEYARIDKSG